MWDIIALVLGNIIAVEIVRAATTGWHEFFLYAIIAAFDAAYLYGKFKP